MLLPYGYFVFIANFVGKEDSPFLQDLAGAYIGADGYQYVYRMVFGLPGAGASGWRPKSARFIYHTTPGVLILYGAAAIVALHAILCCFRQPARARGSIAAKWCPLSREF